MGDAVPTASSAGWIVGDRVHVGWHVMILAGARENCVTIICNIYMLNIITHINQHKILFIYIICKQRFCTGIYSTVSCLVGMTQSLKTVSEGQFSVETSL